jgi:hypothetical protein
VVAVAGVDSAGVMGRTFGGSVDIGSNTDGSTATSLVGSFDELHALVTTAIAPRPTTTARRARITNVRVG